MHRYKYLYIRSSNMCNICNVGQSSARIEKCLTDYKRVLVSAEDGQKIWEVHLDTFSIKYVYPANVSGYPPGLPRLSTLYPNMNGYLYPVDNFHTDKRSRTKKLYGYRVLGLDIFAQSSDVGNV